MRRTAKGNVFTSDLMIIKVFAIFLNATDKLDESSKKRRKAATG